MRELVVSRKRKLQRDPTCFDGDDRDRSDCRADGNVDHCIFLTMNWRNLVDHDQSE